MFSNIRWVNIKERATEPRALSVIRSTHGVLVNLGQKSHDMVCLKGTKDIQQLTTMKTNRVHDANL
jgi:hypothetical protein